jgi:hypothetical protein
LLMRDIHITFWQPHTRFLHLLSCELGSSSDFRLGPWAVYINGVVYYGLVTDLVNGLSLGWWPFRHKKYVFDL